MKEIVGWVAAKISLSTNTGEVTARYRKPNLRSVIGAIVNSTRARDNMTLYRAYLGDSPLSTIRHPELLAALAVMRNEGSPGTTE